MAKKEEWFKNLSLSVITAIIISIINYFVWIKQFKSSNEQALYEHKIIAFEKFTKNASNMIFLLRFMDRVHLNIAKLQTRELLPDTNTLDPFNDIQSKYSATITDDENTKITNKVKKKLRDQYRYYIQANEFLSEFNSTYWSTLNFFNKKTRNQMERLRNFLTPQYYQSLVVQLMKTNKVNINKIADGTIDTQVGRIRNRQLTAIIQFMQDEIQSEKD